jgi:hypothetical protein
VTKTYRQRCRDLIERCQNLIERAEEAAEDERRKFDG